MYIVVAVYRIYLTQWLQIRWRRWMTRHFLDEWLSDRAYYRISLIPQGDERRGIGTENPDQRIAEDLRAFIGDGVAGVRGILFLGIDFLSNIVSLVSFIAILWSLSGPLTVFGVTIQGYMVWVALIYAVLGTVATHYVGRPLVLLNFAKQRVEADFRFSLVRLRENTEGVALYGGEEEEKRGLLLRFEALAANWWLLMQRYKLLTALTAGYGQVASVFPIVVAAPRYFAGLVPLRRTDPDRRCVRAGAGCDVVVRRQLLRHRLLARDRRASFHFPPCHRRRPRSRRRGRAARCRGRHGLRAARCHARSADRRDAAGARRSGFAARRRRWW